MNRSYTVQIEAATLQRTVLSLIGETGGLVTSQTPNTVTASFATRPNLILTFLLLLIGILPGLLYFWFARGTSQLIAQFHPIDSGTALLHVTASGGRAKRAANRLMKTIPAAQVADEAPHAVTPISEQAAPVTAADGRAPKPAVAVPQPQAPQPSAALGGPACAICGGQLELDDRFCTSCGARVPTVPVRDREYEPPAPPQFVPCEGVQVPIAVTASTTTATSPANGEGSNPAESPTDAEGVTVMAEEDSDPEAGGEPCPDDGEATILEEEVEPRPILEALLDSESGEPHRFALFDLADNLTVGRDRAHCDVAVQDPRVSRAHFRISMGTSGPLIEDLGSSNGTYLNGQRVEGAAALSDGDRIEFGRSALMYHREDIG